MAIERSRRCRVALLGRDVKRTRIATIYAIGRIGPAAHAAIPTLEALHADNVATAGAALPRIHGD